MAQSAKLEIFEGATLGDAIAQAFEGKEASHIHCSYGSSGIIKRHSDAELLLAAGIRGVCIAVVYRAKRKFGTYVIVNHNIAWESASLYADEVSTLRIADFFRRSGCDELAQKADAYTKELYGEKVGTVKFTTYYDTDPKDIYVNAGKEVFIYRGKFERLHDALQGNTVKEVDAPEWVVSLMSKIALTKAL